MLIKYSWVFFHIRYIIKKNKVKIHIKTYSIICERWQNWIIFLYSVFKSKFIKNSVLLFKKNERIKIDNKTKKQDFFFNFWENKRKNH
jgi:hypothetical protein